VKRHHAMGKKVRRQTIIKKREDRAKDQAMVDILQRALDQFETVMMR